MKRDTAITLGLPGIGRYSLRSLRAHAVRTVLSTLAVALAAAMIVAADVIGGAMSVLFVSEDLQAIGAGLFGQFKPMLTLLGFAVAAAAGFLVFNAFLMSTTQRRREIGMLRALGMTRRQVMRLILFEALIVGGTGTGVGVVVGPLAGQGALRVLQALAGPIFSAFGDVTASSSSMVLAASLSLGVSLVATCIPAWQAGSVTPLTAIREEAPLIAATARRASPRTVVVHGVFRYGVPVAVLVALGVWLAVSPPGAWVTPPWDLVAAAGTVGAWLLGWAFLLPSTVGGLAKLTRRPLTRLFGGTGRLIADNLTRERLRVTLTLTTLVVGLTMIVGLTGFMTFTFDGLFGPSFQRALNRRMSIITTFDPALGPAGFVGLESLTLPPAFVSELPQVVADRGALIPWYFVSVPELAFLMPGYFSFVFTPEDIGKGQSWVFEFSQGTWETALPFFEEGCAVLISQLVADNNDAGYGDSFAVQVATGPLTCTVAGIGQGYVNASVIVVRDRAAFGVQNPFGMVVSPGPMTREDLLYADVDTLLATHGDLERIEIDTITTTIFDVVDQMGTVLNAFLLLAIVTAAMGVVNTTMISVAERQAELGLLRSLGATRRQVRATVMGEAALTGLLGGALGLVIGTGIAAILPLAYGGNGWGLVGLDLHATAWFAVQPAVRNGLVGLVAAPLTCAGAAALVVRHRIA